jgi:hypothetical protein
MTEPTAHTAAWTGLDNFRIHRRCMHANDVFRDRLGTMSHRSSLLTRTIRRLFILNVTVNSKPRSVFLLR